MNETKNKTIRKEFNATVRASFPKAEADNIIETAKKNNYEENYCFGIYEEATKPM